MPWNQLVMPGTGKLLFSMDQSPGTNVVMTSKPSVVSMQQGAGGVTVGVSVGVSDGVGFGESGFR